MGHSSNVYTVLLLAAFLALVGLVVMLGYKLSNDYKLTPQQMLGLEPLSSPMEKSVPAPKPTSMGTDVLRKSLPAELRFGPQADEFQTTLVVATGGSPAPAALTA